MREIVHLQAGQCGNQIGAKFWEVRNRKAVRVARYPRRPIGPPTIFLANGKMPVWITGGSGPEEEMGRSMVGMHPPGLESDGTDQTAGTHRWCGRGSSGVGNSWTNDSARPPKVGHQMCWTVPSRSSVERRDRRSKIKRRNRPRAPPVVPHPNHQAEWDGRRWGRLQRWFNRAAGGIAAGGPHDLIDRPRFGLLDKFYCSPPFLHSFVRSHQSLTHLSVSLSRSQSLVCLLFLPRPSSSSLQWNGMCPTADID